MCYCAGAGLGDVFWAEKADKCECCQEQRAPLYMEVAAMASRVCTVSYLAIMWAVNVKYDVPVLCLGKVKKYQGKIRTASS